MSLPKLSVSNPVFANLLMIVIIVFGTIAWFVLPRALSPDIEVQSASVTTIYPGASPEEVEKLVTVPIEEAIEDDVNKIDSDALDIIGRDIDNLAPVRRD